MIPKLKTKGAKLVPVPIQPMFEPRKMQGFQSYPQPSSLGPDMFSMLNNARISQGVLTARNGDSATINSITNSGSIRGQYSCFQNGVSALFVAVGDSTHVTIWKSVNEGATWSNISPTSGIYGDTRLTDSTSRPVFFCLMQDNAYGQNPTDVLLIQNGVDSPRVYGYTPGTTTYVMSVQHQPAAVANSTFLTAQPAFQQAFPMNTLGAYSVGSLYMFLVSGLASNPSIGATYTNNGQTFTVENVTVTGNAGTISCTGTGAPTASGTLVYSGGVGPASMAFSSYLPLFSNVGATPPVLTYPTGSGAQVTSSLTSGALSSVSVGAGGSGYASHTVAYPTGGGGNGGGIVSVTVGAGAVTGVSVVSGAGGSYVTPPGIQFVENCLLLTIPANCTNGGTATLTWPGGLNLSFASQLVMIVDQVRPLDYNLIYSNLKISITDNKGVTAVCFDPSSGVGSAIVKLFESAAVSNASGIQQQGSGNAAQVAYSMPPTPGSIDLTKIQRVTFTCVGTSGIATDLAIYLMAGSGDTQGGARFGVSYYGSDSRSIGPGTIITNLPTALPGAYSQGIDGPGLFIQEDQRFFYDYLVTVPITNTSDLAAGINYVAVFREDVGQTYYYYAVSDLCASWNGSAWVPQTNPLIIVRSYPGTALDTGAVVNFAQPLPYASALTVPIGTAMLNINGRTFVCGGNTLWVSDYVQPFTFTLAQRFDSPGNPDVLSGTSQTKAGETLHQIVAIGAIPATSTQASGAISGTGTVYFWSDKNMYQIPGFTPTGLNTSSLIGTHGTLSPYSIAKLRTAIYWLDNEGEVCTFSAGVTALYGVAIPDMQIHVLSLFRVDDQTQNIPASRRIWASGAVNNNRYYLAYTPTGGTLNTKILVWSDQEGLWESIDSPSSLTVSDFAFIAPYYSTSGYVKTLVYGGSTGNLSSIGEYEVPANTNSVAFNVTFRELNSEFFNLIEMDTVQVSSYDISGAGFTLTTSRVLNGATGSPITSSVSWTANQTATKTDAPGTGGSANRILLSVYGTIPGTTSLLAIGARTKRLEASYVQ